MYRFVGRAVAVAAAGATLTAAPALASHGGGGGSTPPPPSGTPAVALSPSTVAYGTLDVGATSAPQTVTLTNTGTASLFINGMAQGGNDPLDFAETDDQCVGTTVAVGASCTLSVVFKPTATGTRTATITVLDTAGQQVITFTGTGASDAGPTPLTIDTQFFACAAGVCDLGSSIVNNFYFSGFSASGDTAPPFAWAVVGGALPPGLALQPNGQLFGNATAQGTFTFTVRVTDPNGQTATQAFSLSIVGPPPPGDPRCQRAPSEPGALSGPAIGGRVPSGQANIDTSTFTACGGFYTINVSVKNVNLPNGTVLWVTLSGRPIGTIALSSGAGSIKPYIYPSTLRRLAIQIYASPPPFGLGAQPILTSGQFI